MSPLLFECLRWMPFPFSFVIVFLTFFGIQLLCTSNPVAEICNDIFFNICVPEICNDIFFNICVPFPFQNKGNWKCLLASTNVSALCLDFADVSAILQRYIHARCYLGQVGRWNWIVSHGRLKPISFAFVETMLMCFYKQHILLNYAHIRQDQRAI